jgi:hypothetical protein
MTNPKMKYTKPTLTALNVAETNTSKGSDATESQGQGSGAQKIFSTPAS